MTAGPVAFKGEEAAPVHSLIRPSGVSFFGGCVCRVASAGSPTPGDSRDAPAA